MPKSTFRIWCNHALPDAERGELEAGVGGHELILARRVAETNLLSGEPDVALRDSDVAFGQPAPQDVIASERLKWVHLSSAGYTRYDRSDVRDALRARGAALTTSSSVYADPCAQHVLAMMLALARRLPHSLQSQQQNHWNYAALRPDARILTGQSVIIVGFGSIGRRLAELLAPFRMNITALRRTARGDEPVPVRAMERAADLLPAADHVVNLLPSGSKTRHFFNAERFARMKRAARFYNVGRGDTVDQDALIEALRSGHVGAAYLDVTAPEPLPSDHPLWTAPHCHITPHIAGGRQAEHAELVGHFLENLKRFETGGPLRDRIV